MGQDDRRDEPGAFDGIKGLKVDENGDITDIEKRPRGILSHTDREYLCGLREYEHVQSESNRKQEIRERIANSFVDFQLLSRLHENDEIYKALREELGEEELYRSVEALIAYIYLPGLFQKLNTLEKIIERGVYIGVNTGEGDPLVGKADNVDVSIDVDYRSDVDRLVQRLEDEEFNEFTPAEIGVLAQEGKLDANDLDAIENTGPKPPFDSSEEDVKNDSAFHSSDEDQ